MDQHQPASGTASPVSPVTSTLRVGIKQTPKQAHALFSSEVPVTGSPLALPKSAVHSQLSHAGKTRTFTCVKFLGRGGFAEVYLARDDQTLAYVPLSCCSRLC